MVQKIKEVILIVRKFVNNSFYPLLLSTLFSIVLNAGLLHNIPLGLLNFLLGVLLLFFSDSDKKISFFAFFMFFGSIYKIPNFSTSILTIILCIYYLFSVIVFLYKNRRSPFAQLRNFFVALLLFIILTMQLGLLTFLYREDGADLRRAISFLIYLLFPLSISIFEKKPVNFSKLLYDFSFGIIASAIVALPCFFSDFYGNNLYEFAGLSGMEYSYVSINNENYRIFRFSGLMFDPNYFAFFSLSTVAMLCASFFRKPNRRDLSIAIILLFFTFLTISKMMITLFLVFVLFFAVEVFRRKPKIGLTKILIFFCLLSSTLLIIGPSLLSIIFSRFSEGQNFDFESTLNSLSTQRFNIWKEFVDVLFHRPIILFFGSGVGSRFNTIAFEGYGAHNSLLETFTTIGVFGFIIMFLYFVELFKNMRHEDSISTFKVSHRFFRSPIFFMLLAPQLGIFALGVASSFIFPFYLWVLLLCFNELTTQIAQKEKDGNALNE